MKMKLANLQSRVNGQVNTRFRNSSKSAMARLNTTANINNKKDLVKHVKKATALMKRERQLRRTDLKPQRAKVTKGKWKEVVELLDGPRKLER